MPITTVLDWLVKSFTDGAPAPERKRFVASAWRIVVAVHILWAWGLLGATSGFATAEDIDDKIAQALAPHLEKLEKINIALSKTVEDQRKTLIREATVNIRDAQRACMAAQPNTPERDRLSLEVDLIQQEYIALTGREYPISIRCE